MIRCTEYCSRNHAPSVLPSLMESPSRGLNLVLSVSKDGPRLQMPWFDKLTTGAAQADCEAT
jgi:hypothetical protein